MIDDCQTWSEYSNITGFFPDNRLINKNYNFFINPEIFKITLRKVLDTLNFSLISLSYHYDIAFKLLWLCFMMECNCSVKQNWPHNFVNSGLEIKFSVLWPTGCSPCLPWPWLISCPPKRMPNANGNIPSTDHLDLLLVPLISTWLCLQLDLYHLLRNENVFLCNIIIIL